MSSSERTGHVRDGASPGTRLRTAEVLLLVLSSLVSLVLLEIALRLYAPIYPAVFEPDERTLIRLVPGAHRAFTRLAVNGGQRIVSHINHAGLRGEELPLASRAPRVIVYGDSNVQAEFSELQATFPKQLESDLRKRDTEVEVLNAGVNGYGPDQVSRRLPQDLAAFRPALVILVVFADNDFGDLIRNRIYHLDGQGALVLNHYQLPPPLRAQLEAAAHPRGWRCLQLARYAARLWGLLRQRFFEATSRLASSGRYYYVEQSLTDDRLAFRDYGAARPGIEYSGSPFASYYDADIALEPDSPSARYKTALMEQVLRELRATAQRTATPLVLLILPSPVDACEDFDYEVNAQRHPGYDRARLSGLIESMARREGIPALNLWYTFRAVDANRYYFHGGDNHWNDAGQAKAAALMAAWLSEQRLLAGPHP